MLLVSAILTIRDQAHPVETSPRTKILTALANAGAKHLVFIYSPTHAIEREEWVYNDADLRNSRVVWARDMGEASNLELAARCPIGRPGRWNRIRIRRS